MADISAAAVVKQYLACLASGDAAGVVALHTDDSVIDVPGVDLPCWLQFGLTGCTKGTTAR